MQQFQHFEDVGIDIDGFAQHLGHLGRFYVEDSLDGRQARCSTVPYLRDLVGDVAGMAVIFFIDRKGDTFQKSVTFVVLLNKNQLLDGQFFPVHYPQVIEARRWVV